jgi:hypothetical protein
MSISFHPRVWLNPLVPPLRAWEKAAIDGWLSRTDPATRELVREQLQRINFAQRNPQGDVVNLYSIPYGLLQGIFPRLLPGVGRERKLSEVEMTIDGESVKADIWSANGRVFSIEFSRPPRQLLTKGVIEVSTVREGPTLREPGPEELAKHLPEDYTSVIQDPALAAQFENDVSVLSPNEIYSATINGRQFWLLAELPDVGMLGVSAEGPDRQVYMLFYDDRAPLPLSRSFRDALTQALQLRDT